MAFTRSTTGCFACKIKHKKCDETKPNCLRCQKSHIECPGYMYIQDTKRPGRKLRTLPAPRTVGRFRALTLQETLLANTEGPHLRLQDQSTRTGDPMTDQALYRMPSTFLGANVGKRPEDIHIWNPLPFSSSINGPLQHSTIDFYSSHGLPVNPASSDPVRTLPDISQALPTTSDQASGFLHSLNCVPPPNSDLSPQGARPAINPNVSLVGWSQPGTEGQDDVTTHDNQDQEEEALGVSCPELVLDKTAQSNALPFVLQGYASWISQTALEPKKIMDIARDFVFSQFKDGEQSRWIIVLLANVGSRIGSVELMEGKYNAMISVLHSAVRRRMAAVKSRPDPTRLELASALDSALEVSDLLYLNDYTRLVRLIYPL
ncbi:hypothetical protein B0J17DRAFT_43019 [Rhizoctonia solani]|nr:hypothetical protein B0J17DRAFT_43019 [Rhizoctonia solani]